MNVQVYGTRETSYWSEVIARRDAAFNAVIGELVARRDSLDKLIESLEALRPPQQRATTGEGG